MKKEFKVFPADNAMKVCVYLVHTAEGINSMLNTVFYIHNLFVCVCVCERDILYIFVMYNMYNV